MSGYVGRFAPSPTGALHAGSLVAALASWLDARAHAGKWLVRIEDVDMPRCVAGADSDILRQLAACGLYPDEAPVVQSQRSAAYQAALNQLIAAQAAYACTCSRKDIETTLAASGAAKVRHDELIYPGTCRHGLTSRQERAWRFHTQFLKQKQPLADTKPAHKSPISIANDFQIVAWQDRRLGAQQQDVARDVGDFVVKRADGLWAYQLAVVVDDAAQGITHVVRGEDLADNTARQILLQQALSYPTPKYLHTPLILAADGHKLSKQNGAQPVMLSSAQDALEAIQAAAQALCLPALPVASVADALAAYTQAWLVKYAHS
jgi:glutamyl-Q tRNA(Asp) synthetase